MLQALRSSNTITPSRAKDPTRTITLRTRFSRDASVRLTRLRSHVRFKVVNQDYFGLRGQHNFNPKSPIIYLAAKPFIYSHTDRKIKGFMDWLNAEHKRGLLEITLDPTKVGDLQGQPWSNTYIRSAYQSGLAQARKDAIARGIKVPPFAPGGYGGIRGVFNQPFHADRVAMLYTRVFSDLEGVAGFIDKSITRVMVQGMTEGIGPYEMARRMNDIVEQTTKKPFPPSHPKGPRGITRARLIARTETIRAHNVATINEMERMEFEIGRKVYSEWVATMDNRTRPEHAARNGNVYERQTALGMLGEPNCRCTIVPWVQALHGKDGKYKVKDGQLKYVSKKVAIPVEKGGSVVSNYSTYSADEMIAEAFVHYLDYGIIHKNFGELTKLNPIFKRILKKGATLR